MCDAYCYIRTNQPTVYCVIDTFDLVHAHTLSTHGVNTHDVNTLCQHTLGKHTQSTNTLSIHTVNTAVTPKNL